MANVIARDADRLPWLTDERVPRKASASWWRLPLVITVVAAIAMASFLFGMSRNWSPEAVPTPIEPEETIALPAPVPAEPVARQPVIAPMPQVEPAPVPAPVVIRMQDDVRPAANSAPASKRVAKGARSTSSRQTAAAPAKPAAERQPLQFSNPWESADASGRMVRIGTYSSLRQGKLAWSRLARTYPAMKKLPAVVTDIPSLRNGRVYYRLQIGTTSQAHSEVLCQRMRSIGQSCVVVDLEGARKGNGDERQPAGL